jgi:hypothetical protein
MVRCFVLCSKAARNPNLQQSKNGRTEEMIMGIALWLALQCRTLALGVFQPYRDHSDNSRIPLTLGKEFFLAYRFALQYYRSRVSSRSELLSTPVMKFGNPRWAAATFPRYPPRPTLCSPWKPHANNAALVADLTTVDDSVLLSLPHFRLPWVW